MSKDRDKPASIPHREPSFPAYSFLEKAAAEARAESRKYWARGGEADRKHPVNKNPGWYAPRNKK